jgi:hypothetical protein
VLFFALSGKSGPKTDESTTASEPQNPSPEPPPVTEPKKPVADLPPDKELERELKDLLDMAKREESTGNYQEALSLYLRVIVKAPRESSYAAQAKGAADLIRDRLKVEKGQKTSDRRFITARGSEEAGREFEARKEEFWRRLGDFDVEGVKTDAQALLDRTREGTAERAAIEETLAKMRYVESLLGIVQSRAAGLPADKARWSLYDDSDPDREFTILGASDKGVELREDATGEVRTKPGPEIPGAVRVSLMEEMRNPTSGTETMWLGAYCLLIGEDRADTYLDRAIDLDPSVRSQVTALRAGK